MNLQEIDLDNNLVIPVPTGQKDALATVVSVENGYTDTVTRKENKEFLGNALELDSFIVNKPDNIRILNRLSDRIMYEETITEANPLTAIEYGKKVILDLIGNKVRENVKSFQTKALQAEQTQILKETEQAIKDALDNDFDGLVAL